MKADFGLLADYARVVVDTNVLLSAAFVPHGCPAELVGRLLLEGKLVFTQVTFAELESRIWKPKFDRYLPIERRQRLLRDFNASALWVDVPTTIAGRALSRDVTGDAFIHAAMSVDATRLISRDNDLLCLYPIEKLHILTPRTALDERDRLNR